jgi:thiol-disulfide isomerase/thioredoxin
MDASIQGSRIAENQFDPARFRSIFNVNVTNDDSNPEEFYTKIKEDWVKQLNFLKDFRTTENYYLNKDFVDFQKQNYAVKTLSAIYDYQAKNSFTDKKFAPPKEFLAELNATMKNPSDMLLANSEYNDWKLKSFIPNTGSKNPDSIIMVKLSEMPKGKEKDRLMAKQLINYFELTNDKAKREELLTKNVHQFQNPEFAKFVAQELIVINNQQKGAVLPPMVFEDKDGGKINFSKFKGKFVVIDFWATWCGPCKVTKPQFEYKAKQFAYARNVVFVAVSIDKDKAKWKSAVKNDQSKVTQLWIGENLALQALNISSIPRFIMIDGDGKMYNANMPRPSDSNFDEIISDASGNKMYKF